MRLLSMTLSEEILQRETILALYGWYLNPISALEQAEDKFDCEWSIASPR